MVVEDKLSSSQQLNFITTEWEMCTISRVTFYNENEELYLEWDAANVGLGASLLQARDGMSFPWNEIPNNAALQPRAFAIKSLTSAESQDNDKEREALVILHGFKKIYPYCFACKVCMITHYKPLLAIFKKDVACLSHRLQSIAVYTPGQCKNKVQNRTTTVYCGLAIQTQSWNKWQNTRKVNNHQCSWIMHGHTKLHDCKRNQNSNIRRWVPKCIGRAHNS